MAATSLHVLVRLEKHQFLLEDRARAPTKSGGLWTNADCFAINLGVGDGRLGVYTNRAAGSVPVTIELVDDDPTAHVVDAEWSRIVLASFVSRGGPLEIRALFGRDRHVAPALALPAASYRVLVCSGGVDTSDYDGSTGADHYRVTLWRAEPTPTRALKTCAHVDDARPTPAETFADALAAIASPDRHRRFGAMAELARHATAEAHAALHATARAGDVLDRVTAVGALGTQCPVHLDQLETFAADDDRRVRYALLSVVHGALRDFDHDKTDVLDSDIAYRVCNRLAADPDRPIADFATRLLTELDGLADRFE